MIRAFVGISLPERAMAALHAQQAGLPVGRPVPPENFHITLAFLGENPTPVVEDVHYALDRIDGTGFHLTLEGIGLFGGERPRSVHASVRPEPALSQLRARVLDAVRGAGIALPRERFHPHVTLARLPASLAADDAARLQAHVGARAGFLCGPFRVDAFALFRSRLGRSGAAYEIMAEYRLSDSLLRE